MRRVVFLVDMNAFYISCEQMRHPEIRSKPAAVAGDPKKRSGIILTANYEARAYGVKTTMTIGEARKRCPDIILLKPDHHFYSEVSSRVMDILSSYTPVLQQNSIDEAWLDMTGSDRLFGEPSAAAKKIMDEILSKLGLWCSIGISENKFLAKMASDMKKPLGITELWQSEIKEKLWPLPVSAMYGVGAKTASKLNSLGLYTIGDMATYGKDILPRNFGKYGRELFALANGEDNDPVTPIVRNSMKSIGRSTTMPRDITDIEEARSVILALSEEVGADARRHNKKGTTVQLTLKYSDFTCITRQSQIPATYLTKEISNAAAALLEKNWTGRPVRLIGVSISGFGGDMPEQLSFFSDTISADAKEEKLEKTIDTLRERFGYNTVKRASLLENKKENKNKMLP